MTTEDIQARVGAVSYDGHRAKTSAETNTRIMLIVAVALAIIVVAVVGGWLIAIFAFGGLIFGAGARFAGLGGEGILKNHRRSTHP